MRFRIVYIMNVDWDWVKQRPHFIAQHLSHLHDVVIVYPYSWRRRELTKNERDGLTVYPFLRLPFGGRFKWIRDLNTFLLRKLAYLFLRWHRPDVIWISSPELFTYLPLSISAKLIYDCMDDILAFPSNALVRDSLAVNEQKLIAMSNLVFCTSNNLYRKLVGRMGSSDKYVINHNAYEPSAFSSVLKKDECKKKPGVYVLGYIGTISSWLDFAALSRIINEFPSIEIHLIGPVENLKQSVPSHERIKWLGIVKHSELQTHISTFDALVMPFQVTDLIESVDPVKLYEYIFFDKPIISIGYNEIERFIDFVDFYTNHEELIAVINRYMTAGFRKKYLPRMRTMFLAKNTWAYRVACIEERFQAQFATLTEMENTSS